MTEIVAEVAPTNEIQTINKTSSPPQNGHTNGHVNGDTNGHVNSDTNGHENGDNNVDVSESESEPAPLFEQDEQLPSGEKRERKSVSRLQDQISKQETDTRNSKKSWQPPNGKGKLLLYHTKVIENLKKLADSKEYDNLKVLYKFLYA